MQFNWARNNQVLLREIVIGFLCLVGSASSQTAKVQANNQASGSLEQRIARVENAIPPIPVGENEPPLQFNLQKLMEVYKVPGLSIAVVDNFKVVWAKGYGVY
jgi:CubicO group peptidase (beta-lactamase class C family)